MKPRIIKSGTPRRVKDLPEERRKKLLRFPVEKIRAGGPTERNYFKYSTYFRGLLKPGTKVLDLGVGHSNFVAEARKRGIDAFGVDLHFASRWARAQIPEGSRKHSIAAIAQQLPLRGGSFNSVVSLYGAVRYAERQEDARHILAEAMRVLRPGGRLAAFPHTAKDAVHRELADLEKAGFRVEVKKPELEPEDLEPIGFWLLTVTKPDETALRKLKRMWKI